MKKVIVTIMMATMVMVSSGMALERWESPKTLAECKMNVNQCARHGWDAAIYAKYDDAIILSDMACKSGLTFGCLSKAAIFDSKEWSGYDPKKAKAMFAAIFFEAVKKCENGEGSECYAVGRMYHLGYVASDDYGRSNKLKYWDKACKLGYEAIDLGDNPCDEVRDQQDVLIRKAQLEEAKK